MSATPTAALLATPVPEGFSASGNAVLRATGISKGFPGIVALDQVDFDVFPGEVHALVGENGAGKSTLMQILAGVYRPDQGGLSVSGQAVSFGSRQDAERAGISIVFQELSLVQQLSVAENIFPGRQPTGRLGLINRARLHEQAAGALAPFAVAVRTDQLVRNLPLASQQIVEIAKALSVQAKVLILDEPTSSLTAHETARLMTIIRALRDRGLGIVYISHHLREVFAVADRITVLRDGARQGTWPAAAVTEQQVVTRMVGRSLTGTLGTYRARSFGEEIVLSARGLSRPREFDGIDLDVRRGEIVGIAGLVGAGRSELAGALFGLTRPHAGTIAVEGRPVRLRTPVDAVRAGMGFLTEDRKQAGLFLAMSIARNVMAPSLSRLTRRGLVDEAAGEAVSIAYLEELHIRARDVNQKVLGLSGGNQQKVLLAMWLATNPRLLIVDEPTRGIDVGSKADIHRLLIDLADHGVAVIVISSELPEVLHLADSVVVMHRGRIVGRFRGGEVDEDTVLAVAAGLGAPAGLPPDDHATLGGIPSGPAVIPGGAHQ